MMERECTDMDIANYDGICFHAQQCAEKYLKARLYEADIKFSKIHDLVALLDQILLIEPMWEFFREDLAYLSDFASVAAVDFAAWLVKHLDYKHKLVKDMFNG